MAKFNRLINPRDFELENFQELIKEASGESVIRYHKKRWEWAMGLKVLRELGYLSRDKIALGFGCGFEPFGFMLTNYIDKSIRTDYVVDSETNYWMRNYAPDGRFIGHDSDRIPKIPMEMERSIFMHMDAMNMENIESSSVDIVYSFSTIEHFGDRTKGPHGSIKAMQESERVLKPGGICFGSTEYILNTRGKHPEFFRQEDFKNEIINSHTMKPLEPFDYTVADGLYRSEYYFGMALKRHFQGKGKYKDFMGIVTGHTIIVSIFFAFIKQ